MEIAVQKRRIHVDAQDNKYEDSQSVSYDCNRKNQQAQNSLPPNWPQKKMPQNQTDNEQDESGTDTAALAGYLDVCFMN